MAKSARYSSSGGNFGYVVALALLLATSCDDAPRTDRDETESPSPTRGAPELHSVGPDDIGPLLRAQPGRVLLVNMWSTWCEPCVAEFPMLVEIGRTYQAQGLSTLFISADPPSNHEAALAFLVAKQAPMPGYVKAGSDGPFIEALHPQWSGTLPATILFDAERRPHYLWEKPVDRDTLSGPIERMLAGDGSRP